MAELAVVLAAKWGLPALHAPLLKEVFPLLLTPLLLVGWRYRHALPRLLRLAHTGLLGAAIAAFGGLCALRARSHILEPPLWDVQCYWLYGKVGVSGMNFYLPSTMHTVAERLDGGVLPINHDADFASKVLDVGFPYPPPGMAQFLPLGLLDLPAATVALFAAIAVALVGVIVVLWRTFFRDEKWLGLALTAALVLTFRPTYSAFAFGQTTFLMFLPLILYWRNQERFRGGAYLGLALAVKPVLAFVPAYAVLRRHWRALLGMVAALGVLSLLVLAVAGWATVTTYFTSNPVDRYPDWTYLWPLEQSLLGGLRRLTANGADHATPLTVPTFIALALLVATFTAWLIWRLDSEHKDLGLAMAIPTSLLVYPHSIEYNGVVLLLPMLFLLRRHADFGYSFPFVVAYVTLAYAFARFNSGDVLWLATLVTWLVLAQAGIRVLARRAPAVAHDGLGITQTV